MTKLNSETIIKIRVLLRENLECKKGLMLRMIESGSDNGLQDRIAEYRAAYNAFNNFDDWADESEDCE